MNSLPPKFNVALVTFAGTATTLVPPTIDRGAVTAAIQSLRPQASTAIGEGIYTSLAALAQVPPDPDNPKAVPPARIVLLSDGKTQVGRPSDQAAMAARAQSVPIYTIAYGTPDGYIDIGGRREPVPVDRAELARVSKISGGEAYTARLRGSSRRSTRTSAARWARRRSTEKSPRATPASGWALRSSLRSDDLPRRPLAVRSSTSHNSPHSAPARLRCRHGERGGESGRGGSADQGGVHSSREGSE